MRVGPLSYIMNKKVKENRYRFTFQKGVVWWDCFARHLYSLAVLPGGCGALPVSGPPPVWEYREGVTTITSSYNSRLRSWWEFSCSEVSSVSPSQEITVFTLFFCFFQQLWGVQILCGTRTNTRPRNQCSGSTRFLPAKETTRGTGTHTVRLISKLGADQLSDPWYSTRDWLLFK